MQLIQHQLVKNSERANLCRESRLG